MEKTITGQQANPGSLGKWLLKRCVCGCVLRHPGSNNQ